VTAALTRASQSGWPSTTTLGLLGAGAVAAIAFVAIEARTRRPVLELALLRRPSFAGVLAAALLYSIAAFAYLAYESLWLQSARGMSPMQTGLALTPLALSALIVSLAAGRWLHVVHAHSRIAGGLALIGAGAIVQAHLGAGSSWPALLPGLVLTGIGVGLATGALASAVLATVPADRGGTASGALNTARQLGCAVGITVLAAAPPNERAGLDHALHAAFAHGLDITLLAAGAGLVAAAIIALALRPRTAPSPAKPLSQSAQWVDHARGGRVTRAQGRLPRCRPSEDDSNRASNNTARSPAILLGRLRVWPPRGHSPSRLRSDVRRRCVALELLDSRWHSYWV